MLEPAVLINGADNLYDFLVRQCGDEIDAGFFKPCDDGRGALFGIFRVQRRSLLRF